MVSEKQPEDTHLAMRSSNLASHHLNEICQQKNETKSQRDSSPNAPLLPPTWHWLFCQCAPPPYLPPGTGYQLEIVDTAEQLDNMTTKGTSSLSSKSSLFASLPSSSLKCLHMNEKLCIYKWEDGQGRKEEGMDRWVGWSMGELMYGWAGGWVDGLVGEWVGWGSVALWAGEWADG